LLKLSDEHGDISPYEVAAQLDANADGQVSVQELFMALLEVGATPAAATKAVEAVDDNGNGYVSATELKRLVQGIKAQRAARKGDVVPVAFEEVTSDEEEDDIFPAFGAGPGTAQSKQRHESKSSGVHGRRLLPGVSNQTALRAINSVRLDMLKKKALQEQL